MHNDNEKIPKISCFHKFSRLFTSFFTFLEILIAVCLCFKHLEKDLILVIMGV